MTHADDRASKGCSCGSSCGPTRRQVVAAIGAAGALAAAGGKLAGFAGPFVSEDFARLIPPDKKLSPEWLASLTARGEPETYRGADLRFIGMPVGGLFCGTVYLGGDGRTWLWDVFNRQHVGVVTRTIAYRGARVGPSDGALYVEPLLADEHRALEQGFTLRVRAGARDVTRTLDARGFRDVAFTGQYPIGVVTYADPEVPVGVKLEAFSPFVPLDAAESSLPATVFCFTLTNGGAEPAEVTITGTLENAVLHDHPAAPALRAIEPVAGRGMTAVRCSARPLPPEVAATRPARPDVVFEDWSKDAYEGWTVEGTAFGRGPVARKDVPAYQGDLDGDTERVVNSHATAPGEDVATKDAAVGKLVSRAFTIERDFVHFWIGGGRHDGEHGLRLVIDGKVVARATGRNLNRMARASFDVRAHAGKRATIEIVDAQRGGWGNVGVGRIWFSDQPLAAEEPEKLPDFGTMAIALLGEPAQATTTSERREARMPEKLLGTVGRTLTLAPGQSAEVRFAIAWHFPRVLHIVAGRERHYAARFADAVAVAQHVADHAERLIGLTRLWRDTWYDSTLPYWFLNRTMANTSTLATTTCHRFRDGRFWAWEGIGCCPGTCTHVWHYAQAMGRLFPEVERDHRARVDFGLALDRSGVIRFRAENGATYAIDGQAGRILGVYREHQMSADDGFLRAIWPAVKRATRRLMETDGDGDGIVRGPLHNTLDADWFGVVPWLCGMYHAALRAAEAMASEVGDGEFAAACRKVLAVAAKNLDATCWSDAHGYYVHRGDPARATEVGAYDGCHIDQVLGQSWAWQVGLGRVMTEEKVRAALKALWTYNFTPDVGPFREAKRAGRWYAMPGDGGMIMVSYPFGAERKAEGSGAWSAMYFNECMSGFEHQVASHMVWEGMVIEGLAVTRAIHDRYNARLRNPYNEVECSDHYARAMASYGTYLAACGFEHHGPRGHLGFAPRLTPEDFRCAFTAAEGWGTFAQERAGDSMTASVEVKHGRLRLRTLALALPPGVAGRRVRATRAGEPVEAAVAVDGTRATVTLAAPLVLDARQRLELTIG